MERARVERRPRQTLFEAPIGAVRQQGRRTRIVENVRQVEQSYGTLLGRSLALGRLVARVSAQREIAGVLLPNTVAAIATVLGRLKHVARVAGEMVALQSVERLARECSPGHQHAATVTMAPDRGETTVQFTTDRTLDPMKLLEAARASGAQDLAVARTIVHVDPLPVLGRGKADDVALSDLARSAAADTKAAEPLAASRAAAGDA